MPSIEDFIRELPAELAKEGAEAILLSPEQMLVSKHMVPANATPGYKTQALIPAADGYAVYLRCSAAGAGKGRPQQRVSPVDPDRWDPFVAGTLHLSRKSLDERWQSLLSTGELLSVIVTCGSERTFDEVDRILTAISEALLRWLRRVEQDTNIN